MISSFRGGGGALTRPHAADGRAVLVPGQHAGDAVVVAADACGSVHGGGAFLGGGAVVGGPFAGDDEPGLAVAEGAGVHVYDEDVPGFRPDVGGG